MIDAVDRQERTADQGPGSGWMTKLANAARATGPSLLFGPDVGEIWFGKDAKRTALAHARAKHTWPAIAGFVVGCALGAACEPAFGLQSLALPTGFALLALVMGLVASLRSGVSQKSAQGATSSPTTRTDLTGAMRLALLSQTIGTSEVKPTQTDVTDEHG